MDKVRESEQLLALQNLRKEYEKELKLCKIDLSDFSDEVRENLYEYASLKESLKLSDLTLTTLEELYVYRKKTKLDQTSYKLRLEVDVKKLEKIINKEKSSMKQLENFVNGVKERFGSQEQMESDTQKIEDEIKILRNKLSNFQENTDIDLDQIIAKVEQLQEMEKEKEKK